MFTEQKCHSEELDRVCVSKKREMKREDGEGGGMEERERGTRSYKIC